MKYQFDAGILRRTFAFVSTEQNENKYNLDAYNVPHSQQSEQKYTVTNRKTFATSQRGVNCDQICGIVKSFLNCKMRPI